MRIEKYIDKMKNTQKNENKDTWIRKKNHTNKNKKTQIRKIEMHKQKIGNPFKKCK